MTPSIPRSQPAARRATVKSTSLRALAVAAHLERGPRPDGHARRGTPDGATPALAQPDRLPHPRSARSEGRPKQGAGA